MAGCWLLRGGGERERSEIGVPGERGGVEEGVLGILQSQYSFKLGSAENIRHIVICKDNIKTTW